MLLRHLAHAHLNRATDELLTKLDEAKTREFRRQMVYEALQAAATFGYELRCEIQLDTDPKEPSS